MQTQSIVTLIQTATIAATAILGFLLLLTLIRFMRIRNQADSIVIELEEGTDV